MVDFELVSVAGGSAAQGAARVEDLRSALEGGSAVQLPSTVWRVLGVRDDKRGTTASSQELAELLEALQRRQAAAAPEAAPS